MSERTPETHDLTRQDYAFRPRDKGQRGWLSTWSGRKPFVGDFLLLKNGERSSRYRVVSVDLCLNVDPATMWMAELEFAPRQYADEARTVEVASPSAP